MEHYAHQMKDKSFRTRYRSTYLILLVMSGGGGGGGGRQAGDDEGFADDDSVEDEAMEVVQASADNEVDEVLNGPRATVYYAVEVPTEPEQQEVQQGKDYTRDEVEEMMQSEAYQRKIATCHLCGKSWFDGLFTATCKECGGFAMTRPCPLCECGAIWKRNVKMSHAHHKDCWDGECGRAQKGQGHDVQLTNSTEDTSMLTAGLQDLSTS